VFVTPDSDDLYATKDGTHSSTLSYLPLGLAAAGPAFTLIRFGPVRLRNAAYLYQLKLVVIS